MRLEHLLSGAAVPPRGLDRRRLRPTKCCTESQALSSVGQSATLIMWRSAVQLCQGLQQGKRTLTRLERQTQLNDLINKTNERRRAAARWAGQGEAEHRAEALSRLKESRKETRAHEGCLWLPEAKKDATSCDKPRSGANTRRGADFRMGQPRGSDPPTGRCPGRTRGTETSQYPEEEKTKVIAPVAASESAGAQTGAVKAARGVVGAPPAPARGA